MAYSLWGCKELNTTEQLTQHLNIKDFTESVSPADEKKINLRKITLYAEQKKKHRFIEQSFILYGRRRGWDVSREQHRNMYTIKGETDHQPRLDA